MRFGGRIAAAAAAIAVLGAAAPAHAAQVDPTLAGVWLLVHARTAWSGTADQGMTTVVRPGGEPELVTRGSDSAVPALVAEGWTHIGDPSSWHGEILDAYQTSVGRAAKLFVLTMPDGRRYDYLHRLAPGEQYNNSFTAIAPGGRWFVSGEWGTVNRLLVFAMPRPVTHPANLRLAGIIRLTRPMRDVQGCAFDSATSLVCSTDDPGTDLYPVARQLLSVILAAPLDGRSTTGRPSLLGAVPVQTICSSSAQPPDEVEGIDIFGNRLTVAVNTPCGPLTELFTYLRDPAVSHDPDPRRIWESALVPVPVYLGERPREGIGAKTPNRPSVPVGTGQLD